MNNKYLKQNIDRLDVPMQAINLLKENGIEEIKQLCNKTKTNLRNIGLNNAEINKLEIELQLLGLDINSNY